MQAIMPSGADKIATFPRREEERFGEEGEEGDRLFEAAMATFKAAFKARPWLGVVTRRVRAAGLKLIPTLGL